MDRGMSVLKKRANLKGMTILLLALSVPVLLMNRAELISRASSQSGSVVNVVVSSTGCTPSSATQSAGPMTIKVANQTGQSELAVQLYGGHGELLREVNITGAAEWSESFDLPSGSYTLVAGHKTEWVCRITVQ